MFMPYGNNESADQPAHPDPINTFVIRCLDRRICLVSISDILSLKLASVAEQVGLFEPELVANPEDRFSREEA